MPQMAPIAPRAEDRLWTAEEFLDWLEPGVRADLIDGQRHMHSPVNFKHARLVNFVHCLLNLYVERRKLGEVHRETVAVRLSARNVFLPDVCFFTREQVERLNPTFAPFGPTFVAEALSPRNTERDTKTKFAKYEAHGVHEYWVLDPTHVAHRFYRREGDLLVEFARGEERIHSFSVQGFWVKRAWLDPERLPDVLDCLREIMGKL